MEMQYETLQVLSEGPITTITLNRPHVLNALNQAMIHELDLAFTSISEDNSVQVVLVRGAGEKAFAAGADIAELADADARQGELVSERTQRVFRRIETLGKPVIACIHGFALGGGCELAMACTLRLGSQSARLGQPEIKLGLIPGYGGTYRLPRLVGRGQALRLLLTGSIVDAPEALRIGLLDEVVSGDLANLIDRAKELAAAVASMPPLAVSAVLEAVDGGIDLSQNLSFEAGIFGRLCGTEDKREGTRAFIEKRPAVWVGR